MLAYRIGTSFLIFFLLVGPVLAYQKIAVYSDDECGNIPTVRGVNFLAGVHDGRYPHVYSRFGAGIWNPSRNAAQLAAVNLAKELRFSAVRYPGGSGGLNYRAKNRFGDDKDYAFGIDEFLDLSGSLGASPIFTINPFTETTSEAGDLASYLSLKKPRAFFEIGNEVYLPQDGQFFHASRYASEFLKYYAAVKSAAPHGAVGLVLNDEEWNRVVISSVSGKVDFGILHVYPTPVWGKPLENMSAKEIFEVSLAQPETKYQPLFDHTRELFRKYAGKDVPLAITEFNGGFVQDKPVPYRHTLGNALVNAELLRVFMKPENNIIMANHWNFVNEYWGMIANGFHGDPKDLNRPYYKRPNYYVFELYAKHFGDELIKVDVQSDTYDVSQYASFKQDLAKSRAGKVEGRNLLDGNWAISAMEGVTVSTAGGLVQVNFEAPKEFNFYHAAQAAAVEPNAFYKVSGYIKTEDLVAEAGVSLEVQDNRGWTVTKSAVSTEKIKGTTDWQYVEAIYPTLPDAKAVRVIARRIGNTGPLTGKAYFKDVKLEKFVPAIDSKIPYLSVNASKSSDNSKVYLMVVNKDLENPQTATISLEDFQPAPKGSAWVLNGPSIISTNEQKHDTVRVREHTFAVPGPSFEFTFEPHSVTAIELEGKK